jgi:hypothetical protein
MPGNEFYTLGIWILQRGKAISAPGKTIFAQGMAILQGGVHGFRAQSSMSFGLGMHLCLL